jgi:hypothetical protein
MVDDLEDALHGYDAATHHDYRRLGVMSSAPSQQVGLFQASCGDGARVTGQRWPVGQVIRGPTATAQPLLKHYAIYSM